MGYSFTKEKWGGGDDHLPHSFILNFICLAVLGLYHRTGFSQFWTQALERSASVVAAGRLTACRCGARASHRVAPLVAEHRLSAHRLQELWLPGSRAWPQSLWRMDLVVQRHVESSWTRVQTRVSCVGRQILYHRATGEALFLILE